MRDFHNQPSTDFKHMRRHHVLQRHSMLRRLMVVAVALGFVACGEDNGPVSPSVQGPIDNPATVTINGVELLKAPGGLRLASSASVQMDQSGGTVSVDGAWLTVPSGALSGSTTITMANASEVWAYNFGPDGLTFNSSATLTVKITVTELVEIGIDPNDLRIAYATNGLTNDWQILGGSYDVLKQEIKLPVDHFSIYSLCIE